MKKLVKTPIEDWKWFGVAGHFICGQWCRFHLCTQVGNYLVSTVGEYVHPRHSEGSELKENEWLKKNWPGEDIGAERKYETMVFLAGPVCTDKDCNCGMPRASGELDFKGYNRRKDAQEGHYKMCLKFSKR